MFGIVFLWHHPSNHQPWWGGRGLVISTWSCICWQPAPTRKDHWDWMLLRGKSGCRWIRYPCKENAPSANEFLLWWFIAENWAGQKCCHETSFLKPGLFCWNCAEHSWLSPMPEEESLRKPTCTPGRSLPGQEEHSVHKSLAPERMHLVDLPQGQGCWELCSCPLSLTSSDMSFTGRLQQGLGSFWLPGNCSPFKKKNNLKKVSVQFG